MAKNVICLWYDNSAEEAAKFTLPDIHDEVITALKTAGFTSASQILEDGAAEKLAAIEGFDKETVDAVIASAKSVAVIAPGSEVQGA